LKSLLDMQKEGITPLALKKRVLLKRGLRKYKDAFSDLSAQREFNQAGVQSITFSEIEHYLNLEGEHRPEHRKVFRRLILDMDTVFMDHVRKKMEKERAK
jgi:hypothetical protein